MIKYPQVSIKKVDIVFRDMWRIGEDGIQQERHGVEVHASVVANPHLSFNTSTQLALSEQNEFDALCAKIGQRILSEFTDALGKTP